jgi:hypothetical protein
MIDPINEYYFQQLEAYSDHKLICITKENCEIAETDEEKKEFGASRQSSRRSVIRSSTSSARIVRRSSSLRGSSSLPASGSRIPRRSGTPRCRHTCIRKSWVSIMERWDNLHDAPCSEGVKMKPREILSFQTTVRRTV